MMDVLALILVFLGPMALAFTCAQVLARIDGWHYARPGLRQLGGTTRPRLSLVGPMSRERYAAEALNLIHLIGADVEAAGKAMVASGLTTHEAATAMQHMLDALRPEDADVAPEPRCLQELHQCG